VALLLGAAAWACDAAVPPAPVTFVVEGDTIRLAPGAQMHDVEVRAREGESEFSPDRLGAWPGDVVRFITGDGRGHALAFHAWTLSDSATTFLEKAGQRRGPPLLHAGAVWIVTLENAPIGEYRVTCLVHGDIMTVMVLGT
jgi:plastocyanin